jgi:hypothetical protein
MIKKPEEGLYIMTEENKLEELEEKLVDIEEVDTNLKVGYQGKREDVGKLAKKLADVMGAIQDVEKNGENNYHNYKYATESDILDEVRPRLAEKGVFPFSSIEKFDREKKGKNVTTIVGLLVTFMDESGASFTVRYFGEGQDNQDKSFYKAYTGALKYTIMKNFLISTDDDPEKDKRSNRSSGRSSSRSSNSTSSKKKKKKWIGRIKKMYKNDEGTVEKVAGKYLESAGKEKDISKLEELSVKTLSKLAKEVKEKSDEIE